MSVLHLATLAVFMALAFAIAPATGQASAVEPTGFHSFSQSDRAVAPHAVSGTDEVLLAHQGPAVPLTTRPVTGSPSPLPLAGWLLGAALLGLAAAEFRGTAATRS